MKKLTDCLPSLKAIFFITILFIGFSCKNDEELNYRNQKLWYTYPAKYWNSQALHLGNSYFGASFFGGVEEETFALTEKSMWLGAPANGNWEKAGINLLAKESLPKIRSAVLENDIRTADSLVKHNFYGSSELFGSFTSIGELKIKFNNPVPKTSNYTRTLDLARSLGQVEYSADNINFKREYFCSYPDRLLAMKFTSDTKNKISFELSMNVMQDSSIVKINNNQYQLTGYINGNNRPFCVLIHVDHSGGEIKNSNNVLHVSEADSAFVYLTIATNYKMEYPDYVGEEPKITTNNVLNNALNIDYAELKRRHIVDYQNLYNRVSFQLETENKTDELPTNERFQNLKNGGSDQGYKELVFNLGRYLIISSSRPNTLPANLQGVWNAFLVAPWSGNYQSNINLQEIYWSCGPTNLIECQQPYIDWIEDMAISGKEVAKQVYGTNGWVSHTTGNIWGHAAPIGGHPWGMYPLGAAWHCQHVWEQYAFTGDTNYLRTLAYPLLKGASQFWIENLIPFNNYYITAPSISAEHGALMTDEGLNPAFHDFHSDKYQYNLQGIYQDMEMIWDLFTNTSKAAELVGDFTFKDSLINTREKLLLLAIGKHGQLQEWYEDIDHPDCHHRHIAHLYAVCPGTQIHPTTTPDLAEAAKKSLNMRGDGRYLEQELASGGNWARAHRMWSWTRLLDGNRANKILTDILTEQGFENALTFQHASYHWERRYFYTEDSMYLHFQLDASASIPGCIAEMLIQSHLGEIHLLPALPDEFHTGKISGIKARGGYTIDMEWKDKKLLSADIYTKTKIQQPKVRIDGKIIDLEKNKKVTYHLLE